MGISVFMQTVISGLLMGGIYSLASIGLTIVFGVLKIVNFAHGEFLMIGMYLTYLVWIMFGGLDPLLGLLIVMPLMFLFGMFVYRTLIKPIVRAPEPAQIFLTVALGLVLQNVALLVFTSNYRSVTTSYTGKAFDVLGINVSVPRLLAFVAAVVLTGALSLFLSRTYAGKAMRAAAQDRAVATLMGIEPDKVFTLTMGLGAAVTGAAGAIVMPYLYVFPTVGVSFGLMSFAVAIIGGLGNIKGAFFCGILVGVAEALGMLYVGADAGTLLAFLLLIATLMFKPYGLLSRSQRRG